MTQETWTEISADDKPARAKHTPGPWIPEYGNSDERSGGQWYDVGPARIGFSYQSPDNIVAQVDADAKLIAAAPTMLAVLHQVSRHFAILAAHGTPVDVTLEDAVHEAIDNAGGY